MKDLGTEFTSEDCRSRKATLGRNSFASLMRTVAFLTGFGDFSMMVPGSFTATLRKVLANFRFFLAGLRRVGEGATEGVPRKICYFFLPAMFFLTAACLLSYAGNGQTLPRTNPFPSTPNTPSTSSRFERRLTVYLKETDGSPCSELALVSIYSFRGGLVASGSTQGGKTEFHEIGAGQYTVEAAAPGYETARADVQVEEGYAIVDLEIRRETNTRAIVNAHNEIPLLSPKAEKEINKGLAALRANNLQEAETHFRAAYAMAPGHPDVNYLLGLVLAQKGRIPEAQELWQTSIKLYPHHAGALFALGETHAQQGDLPGALEYFKEGAKAAPGSRHMKAALSGVYFQQRAYAEALRNAEQALELGKEKAGLAHLLQAQSLEALGQRARAIETLEAYLVKAPAGEAPATAARKLLEKLRGIPAEAPARETVAAPLTAVNLPSVKSETELFLKAAWSPPNVDQGVPPVEDGVGCPLGNVLQTTGKRMAELLHTFDRFTATEQVRHEEITRSGQIKSTEERTFNYVVSISEIRPGWLNTEEYRNTSQTLPEFPGGIATMGLPALVFAFHPYYRDNYEMVCEGLSKWKNTLAWQVHFRQRSDKPATLMSHRKGDMSYPVPLKGRAWISVFSSQIIRMEVDIVGPMPDIRLLEDHVAIEYGPVQFRDRKIELWLPKSAEIFLDIRGRRMRRQHIFTNYLLFSVDDKQEIKAPVIPVTKKEESQPPQSS